MKRRTKYLSASLLTILPALCAVWAVHAQITLPTVQTPRLPQLPLPVDLDKAVSDVTRTLDPNELVDLRRLRVRALLREQRAVLEADPRGALTVRAEVTAFSPSADALVRAQAAGFVVAREQVLEGLEARIVVLRAPPRMSTKVALRKLREMDPDGVYDFNHVYLESGAVGESRALPQLSAPAAGASLPTTKVGLIDGGVDASHPAFAGETIHSHGCNPQPVPSAHGTAVASLLIGRTENFRGVAPNAVLYAADVYCGQPAGGAVDAIAQAFSWLAREKVGVINVSLVGPPNAMLENVIRLMMARGHLIVAAVGNDGPNAPPLYPAAYPDVVGVTGVDGKRRVLLEALRGKQVDFAAQGADFSAANAAHSFVAVRGTSFAAPIVTGVLAAGLPAPDKSAADRVLQQLAAQAIDLGDRGPDLIYGQGFVVTVALN